MGYPGGAIADGENTIEGALRESYEEANITPEDIEVVGLYCVRTTARGAIPRCSRSKSRGTR